MPEEQKPPEAQGSAPAPEQPKPAAAPAPPPVAPKPAAKPAAPAPPPPPPPWEGELPVTLKDEFGEKVSEFISFQGQPAFVAQPDAAHDILESLRDFHEFDYLVDVTAVHWPKREPAFDIIYILYSFSRNERIRIKAEIAEGERPQSSAAIYPGANWLEREVFDMFGVRFAGHPDLKRILLPDEWTGHPLRKDYSINQMDNRWVRENLGVDSGQ